MPAFVVPFFFTFTAPRLSSMIFSSAVGGPLSVPLGYGVALFGLTVGPILKQPFDVALGFSLIPATAIAQILAAGKSVVDLS